MSTYGGENRSRIPTKKQDPPSYGPFKIGDLPKQGYNRTVGKNAPYIEDP